VPPGGRSDSPKFKRFNARASAGAIEHRKKCRLSKLLAKRRTLEWPNEWHPLAIKEKDLPICITSIHRWT
jgi:hypothetical protein